MELLAGVGGDGHAGRTEGRPRGSRRDGKLGLESARGIDSEFAAQTQASAELCHVASSADYARPDGVGRSRWQPLHKG